MRVKLLFVLVLNLATIGLSLTALACGPHHSNRHDSKPYDQHVEHQDTKSSRYYGNYYPYEMKGDYVYVGSKGDYFDRYGEYHPEDEHPEYKQHFNPIYRLKDLGNYYDKDGKYHDRPDNLDSMPVHLKS